MKLPQPYKVDEVRKDPKAVVISLLIGLLLTSLSAIGVLYYRREDDVKNFKEEAKNCQADMKTLYNQMLSEKNHKLILYEEMIFYKKQYQHHSKQDSIIRQKTEPLVKEILNQ